MNWLAARPPLLKRSRKEETDKTHLIIIYPGFADHRSRLSSAAGLMVRVDSPGALPRETASRSTTHRLSIIRRVDRGISPPVPHRSVRESLISYGSCQPFS
jgi:hypothetical protein